MCRRGTTSTLGWRRRSEPDERGQRGDGGAPGQRRDGGSSGGEHHTRPRLVIASRGDGKGRADPVRERGSHWVRPELVAQVGFSEWTGDGKLRHPRFIGLREDKKLTDVVREQP